MGKGSFWPFLPSFLLPSVQLLEFQQPACTPRCLGIEDMPNVLVFYCGVINYYRCSGSKQRKFIVLQFLWV